MLQNQFPLVIRAAIYNRLLLQIRNVSTSIFSTLYINSPVDMLDLYS